MLSASIGKRERNIRIASVVVIMCWFPLLMAVAIMWMMGLVWPDGISESPLSLAVFIPTSLVYMVFGAVFHAFRLYILSLAVGILCLVLSMIGNTKWKWSRRTIIFAVTAVAGHLTFLLLHLQVH